MSFAMLKQMSTSSKYISVRGKEDEDSLPFTDKDVERSSTESKSSRSSSSASSLAQEQTIRKRSSKFDARVVSDAIIGLSDGLTVPFALTAGLSAMGDTKVVIYGGLAELTAGAISMGLGGYLGAKSEEESYIATYHETHESIRDDPSAATSSIAEIFSAYDVPSRTIEDLTKHLSESPRLADFLMHFQHTLAEPPASRALTCAFTIAMGYFIGGFIPLLPYFFCAHIDAALWFSVAIMAWALFAFGYGKTCFVSGWAGPRDIRKGVVGGLQMVVVGGAAAGSAMALVRIFQSFAPS